jgi:hypothetical protein
MGFFFNIHVYILIKFELFCLINGKLHDLEENILRAAFLQLTFFLILFLFLDKNWKIKASEWGAVVHGIDI